MATHGYALEDADTDFIINNYYGSFYAYGKTIAFNITTADVYHAFGQRTADDITVGPLRGWTFDAGRIVDANINQLSSDLTTRHSASRQHLLDSGRRQSQDRKSVV
jgi:hypothetical protein